MVTADSDGPPIAVDDYELHENVLIDLVNYIRSNTIRNEEAFALLMLSYTTGLQRNPQHFDSAVIIGTSSSGKSHMKQKGETLLEHLEVYTSDSGSEKSMIHDDYWNEVDVVSMGELNQPPDELIEFLKRVHGGDEQFEYSVTTGSMRDGFDSETIVKDSKPYVFTYAQWDPDFEMWNRLLKISAHESESKNRAVMRMAAGENQISIDGDVEYGYAFDAGTDELQKHFLRVREAAPDHVAMPAQSDVEVPVTEIMEPIFNHGRSEVNRIYWMVFNLIRASALLNFEHRDQTTIRYDGEEVEAVCVEPQDVANVVRLRPALMATTHELDDRKRAVLQAIQSQSGRANEVDGVGKIREWLKQSDAPELKQDELKNILLDLEQNFLVDIREDAGENGDLYRAYQLDQLGVPKIDEHSHFFEDCTDPLTGRPFLDVWPEQRSQDLTSAKDMMAGADDIESNTTGSVDTDEEGNAGFGNFGTDTEGVELTPVQLALGTACLEHIDGRRIPDLSETPIEAFLGLVKPVDPQFDGIDKTGTLLDPTHDVWDQPNKDDSWVAIEKDARKELTRAMQRLVNVGILTYDEVYERDDADTVIDARLSVDETALTEAEIVHE